MVRVILTLICGAHGVAHLVGFFSAWRPDLVPALPHKTTVLAGRLDLGETGIRVLGILWLLMAIAFAVAGVLVWLKHEMAGDVLLWVATASAVLSVLAWPDSQIGVVMNLSIVLLVLASVRYGWLPSR